MGNKTLHYGKTRFVMPFVLQGLDNALNSTKPTKMEDDK
jgi:hypothetical protein